MEDLFYNLPARRKFLKSDAAEAAHVSKIVTQLALCHPAVGVTLTSAGRLVLQCPPAGSLEDRLFQIYGERPDLVAVSPGRPWGTAPEASSRRWPIRGRRAARSTSS